ncbi:hypothetical protein TNCV_8011 [Trichonephila clavipes]|nr:hypothetical protein TNCV_8011 [Trichonephila clavipes]
MEGRIEVPAPDRKVFEEYNNRQYKGVFYGIGQFSVEMQAPGSRNGGWMAIRRTQFPFFPSLTHLDMS